MVLMKQFYLYMKINNDEYVLTSEETRAFIYNMLHPNAEAIACRDTFLADLVLTYNTDGSIETELKGVSFKNE